MKKVLIVAPHPDDETFWMGGTILKLKENNHKITLLAMSLGESSLHPTLNPEELKQQRKAELENAIALLGIDSVLYANLKDRHIKQDEAYQIIKQTLQDIKPDRVYLPCNPDTHQDHIATSRGGKLACFHENIKEIFIYDSSHQIGPMNYYEDISTVLDKKLDICTSFASQILKEHFSIEKIKARALLRGTEVRRHAAEAFKVVRQVS